MPDKTENKTPAPKNLIHAVHTTRKDEEGNAVTKSFTSQVWAHLGPDKEGWRPKGKVPAELQKQVQATEVGTGNRKPTTPANTNSEAAASGQSETNAQGQPEAIEGVPADSPYTSLDDEALAAEYSGIVGSAPGNRLRETQLKEIHAKLNAK